MNPNPSNSQEALAQLQGQQAQAQNPNDILSGQRQQLGVDASRNTVTGLRGAINNTTKLLQQVAPSVMGRTGSSLVTSAQAGKQIQNEQAPISQNLSDQGREYTQASQDLNELESQAAQAASGIYQGQQDKLSYAQNLYNTLYQREQAAEEARRAELARQEQIRQFNEQLAASRKAASGGAGGFGLGSSTISSPQAKPSSIQDAAYLSVQNYLKQGKERAAADYAATMKSALKGNAMDKLKIQLYEQNGIRGTGTGILRR
jgi:chromosome segregation ATPase